MAPASPPLALSVGRSAGLGLGARGPSPALAPCVRRRRSVQRASHWRDRVFHDDAAERAGQYLDVNKRAPDGCTPLVAAVLASDRPLARALIDRGAQLDPAKHDQMPRHWRPKDYTALRAAVEMRDAVRRPRPSPLAPPGASTPRPDGALPPPPRRIPPARRSQDTVRLLLDLGADVEALSTDGSTCLQAAVLPVSEVTRGPPPPPAYAGSPTRCASHPAPSPRHPGRRSSPEPLTPT